MKKTLVSRKAVVEGRRALVAAKISTENGYFSVTGNAHYNFRRDLSPSIGGCIHEILLKIWPKSLKNLIPLHLSDLNGVPMYAVENGFYWIAGACGGLGEKYHGANDGRHTPDDCYLIAKNHFRANDADISALMEEARKRGKAAVEEYVSRQLPRWKMEAQKALDFIAAL